MHQRARSPRQHGGMARRQHDPARALSCRLLSIASASVNGPLRRSVFFHTAGASDLRPVRPHERSSINVFPAWTQALARSKREPGVATRGRRRLSRNPAHRRSRNDRFDGAAGFRLIALAAIFSIALGPLRTAITLVSGKRGSPSTAWRARPCPSIQWEWIGSPVRQPPAQTLHCVPHYCLVYDVVHCAARRLAGLREFNRAEGEAVDSLSAKDGRKAGNVDFLPRCAAKTGPTIGLNAATGALLRVSALHPWKY
jgi:hypothetical protein